MLLPTGVGGNKAVKPGRQEFGWVNILTEGVEMNKIYAVLAAAGKGRRLETEIPKQYLLLAGKPLLAHSLLVLDRHFEVDGLVLVVGAGWEDEGRCLAAEIGVRKLTAVVTGGRERQESVYRGLLAVPDQAGTVQIHDAARPLITDALISRMIAAALRTGAAVPAIPVKDTVKVADSKGLVQESLERSCLVAVQTPQAFARKVFVAHMKAVQDKFQRTDDAMLVERLGLPVEVVAGDERNLKITTKLDLKLAELLMTE